MPQHSPYDPISVPHDCKRFYAENDRSRLWDERREWDLEDRAMRGQRPFFVAVSIPHNSGIGLEELVIGSVIAFTSTWRLGAQSKQRGSSLAASPS